MRSPSLSRCSSLAAAACGSGRVGTAIRCTTPSAPRVADVAVSDDAFAGAVRDLLASEPQSKERQLRLARRRRPADERASRTRFQAKNRDNAVVVARGRDVPRPRGRAHERDARAEAATTRSRARPDEFAKKGDEGRARATYEMLMRVAPPQGEGRHQGPPRRDRGVDARHRRAAARCRPPARSKPPPSRATSSSRASRRATKPSRRRSTSSTRRSQVKHGAPHARRADHARRRPRGGARARDGHDGARRDLPSQRRSPGRARRASRRRTSRIRR